MWDYLKVFIVGFGMVFLILVILIGMLSVMRALMGIKTQNKNTEPKSKKEKKVEQKPVAPAAPVVAAASGDDDEIAAVISAVLMMLSAESEATGKKLVLKSIKACNTSTVRRRAAWGDMARREQMNNF